MAKAFAGLNDDHMARFNAKMERLGLNPDALTHEGELVTGATPGPTVLSGDPDQSHLPPTLVRVNDVAHLKALSGLPDEHYVSRKLSDRTVEYPAPLDERRAQIVAESRNQCDLEYRLNDDELRDVRRAARAYVMGHSEKVKSHEPVINAMLFPTQLAVFAGESIVVTKDKPLIITGDHPVSLNYGSITVEDGGQIIIQVTAEITSQVFTQQ